MCVCEGLKTEGWSKAFRWNLQPFHISHFWPQNEYNIDILPYRSRIIQNYNKTIIIYYHR